MTTKLCKKEVRKPDPNLITSQSFAQCLCAYLECSPDAQEVIQDMAKIVNDPQATEDERQAAIATIADALFPSGRNGVPGVDLQEAEGLEPQETKSLLRAMDEEENTFAERLKTVMERKGMTQAELAAVIDVSQPAISMMLARQCRPQRRTVERIAQALKVPAEELWPGIGDI